MISSTCVLYQILASVSEKKNNMYQLPTYPCGRKGLSCLNCRLGLKPSELCDSFCFAVSEHPETASV